MVMGDFSVQARASLDRAGQGVIATMGLTQLISGPLHQRRHTLNMVFCCDRRYGNLKVGNLQVVPLSWEDNFQISIRLKGASKLHKEGWE